MAAARVYDGNKIAKANTELASIAQSIKALYGGRSSMNMGSADITSSLINMNIFPSDMMVNGWPTSPWGTQMEIIGAWPDSAHFIVEFDGQDHGRTATSTPTKYCMPLLLENYQQTATDITEGVEITNGGWRATTSPLPASTFAGCTTASFVYSIH